MKKNIPPRDIKSGKTKRSPSAPSETSEAPQDIAWPEWNEQDIANEKWQTKHIYEDTDTIRLPRSLKENVESWKRPSELWTETLLVAPNNQIEEYMRIGGEETLQTRPKLSAKLSSQRPISASTPVPTEQMPFKLLSDNKHVTHSQLMRNILIHILQLAKESPWNCIYPKAKDGQPAINPSGKYILKLFYLGQWRKVCVDDRIPCDKQGKPLVLTTPVVGELWLSLLVKGILKLAGSCFKESRLFDECGEFDVCHVLTGLVPQVFPLVEDVSLAEKFPKGEEQVRPSSKSKPTENSKSLAFVVVPDKQGLLQIMWINEDNFVLKSYFGNETLVGVQSGTCLCTIPREKLLEMKAFVVLYHRATSYSFRHEIVCMPDANKYFEFPLLMQQQGEFLLTFAPIPKAEGACSFLSVVKCDWIEGGKELARISTNACSALHYHMDEPEQSERRSIAFHVDAANGYLLQIWSNQEWTFVEEAEYLKEKGMQVEIVEESYGAIGAGQWNILYHKYGAARSPGKFKLQYSCLSETGLKIHFATTKFSVFEAEDAIPFTKNDIVFQSIVILEESTNVFVEFSVAIPAVIELQLLDDKLPFFTAKVEHQRQKPASGGKKKKPDDKLTEPQYRLKVISPHAIRFERDTEKEDLLKKLKHEWETKQPGRALISRESRDTFLKSEGRTEDVRVGNIQRELKQVDGETKLVAIGHVVTSEELEKRDKERKTLLASQKEFFAAIASKRTQDMQERHEYKSIQSKQLADGLSYYLQYESVDKEKRLNFRQQVLKEKEDAMNARHALATKLLAERQAMQPVEVVTEVDKSKGKGKRK